MRCHVRAGMSAPQAAGVIHTDFERGFIRAETVGCACGPVSTSSDDARIAMCSTAAPCAVAIQ